MKNRNVLRTAAAVGLGISLSLSSFASARGQQCVGDCNDDQMVSVGELVRAVGVALGKRPGSNCPIDEDGVRIEELIRAVSDSLGACEPKLSATGTCMRASPRGLEPCPEGMRISVQRCDDPAACLRSASGLVTLNFGMVGPQGRFELTFSGRQAGEAPLVFEAEVETGSKYRVLDFGRAGGGAGSGIEVDLLIDPASEAAVRLIAENGFENFTAEEVFDVLGAVRLANAGTDFTAPTAEEGARRATEVARTDPGVIAAIERALETPVERGLRQIAVGDLRAANQSFREAAQDTAPDPEGELLYAITRIATRIFEDPQLKALRERAGVRLTGDIDNLCDIVLELPVVNATRDELPIDAPSTAEIQQVVESALLPELFAAKRTIAGLPPEFLLRLDLEDLPKCIRPTTLQGTLEVDYADVLLFDAALEAAMAGFDLGEAYDLDTALRPLLTVKEREVFESAPNLFTLTSPTPLPQGRTVLDSALTKLVQALDAIRGEKDDQSDDLLVIPAGTEIAAQTIEDTLEVLRTSFTAAVLLPASIGLPQQRHLDLTHFFAGELTALQPFFPNFDDDGDFLCTSCFDDPTFGGTLPDIECEDPLLECEEIETGVNGIVHSYVDLATATCAQCEFDEDCVGILGVARPGSDRPLRFGCFSCSEDCTGEVSRCAPLDGFAQCSDGMF